jgi:hypothetical protein
MTSPGYSRGTGGLAIRHRYQKEQKLYAISLPCTVSFPKANTTFPSLTSRRVIDCCFFPRLKHSQHALTQLETRHKTLFFFFKDLAS